MTFVSLGVVLRRVFISPSVIYRFDGVTDINEKTTRRHAPGESQV